MGRQWCHLSAIRSFRRVNMLDLIVSARPSYWLRSLQTWTDDVILVFIGHWTSSLDISLYKKHKYEHGRFIHLTICSTEAAYLWVTRTLRDPQSVAPSVCGLWSARIIVLLSPYCLVCCCGAVCCWSSSVFRCSFMVLLHIVLQMQGPPWPRTYYRCWQPVLYDRKIPLRLKSKEYDAIIGPALTYRSECWAVKVTNKRKIATTEMRMLRGILRVSRREHMRNEEIRRIGPADMTHSSQSAELSRVYMMG